MAALTTAPALAQTPPPYAPETIPAPQRRPSAMLGASIYQQNCALCHGVTGGGDGTLAASGVTVRPLDDHSTTWALAPAEAFHLTKYGNGTSAKPALQAFLNDEQLWQAIFYAWSLHTNTDEVATGSAIYTAECALCHGDGGRGDGPETTDPLGVDFTDLHAINMRSTASLAEGWRSAHVEIGAELSEAERIAVLEAIRAFTYLSPWESPYVRGEGEIAGRIVHGSAGASTPAGQEVTLMVYMNFTPVSVFTTTIDAAGHFTFEQAATSPDIVYYVGTTYDNVVYGSNLFALSVATPTVELTIPVYETTTDASQLRFNRVQWVIDHQPGALRVRAMLVVANNLDRTVVGEMLDGDDRAVTVALPIPADAVDIEFQDGALDARYVSVGGSIYDTTPIRPGAQNRQIVLAYSIPYAKTNATIATDIAYPVDTLSILVADLSELTVEVSGPLENVGNQTVQNVAYRVWNGALAEPAQLAITLQNLIPAGGVDPRLVQAQSTPAPIQSADTASSSTIPPLFAGIAVAAVVLVLGGGILYWKFSRDKVGALYALRREKERLLTAIAALDECHDQGDLDDERWSDERVALMTLLREVNDSLDQIPQSRKHG